MKAVPATIAAVVLLTAGYSLGRWTGTPLSREGPRASPVRFGERPAGAVAPASGIGTANVRGSLQPPQEHASPSIRSNTTPGTILDNVAAPRLPPVTAMTAPRRGVLATPDRALFDDVLNPANGDPTTAVPDAAKVLHERFNAEAVDPAWAPAIESSAERYFSQQPSAATADVVSLECHATMCEILTVAQSPALSSEALEEWQTSAFHAPAQIWASQYGLKDIALSVTTAPDGRALIATYLSTKLLHAAHHPRNAVTRANGV